MADDWRVTVELDDEGHGIGLLGWLHEARLEADVRARLGERVAVSRDGSTVFLYVDSEERAREAEAVVRAALEERGLAALVTVTRWHPVEQRWEDAAVPLPRTDAELAAEHERRERREEAESQHEGAAEWEVRIELPGHEKTNELADRLEDEGIPAVRRWRYLLVGASSEDQARALAERLRDEAPSGAKVEVQAGGEMVWQVAPQNPFAVFGGLGV
jgi:hypothetical protein